MEASKKLKFPNTITSNFSKLSSVYIKKKTVETTLKEQLFISAREQLTNFTPFLSNEKKEKGWEDGLSPILCLSPKVQEFNNCNGLSFLQAQARCQSF